jgi:putative inorganic carbon (hco3(-)) transporter
VIYSIRNSSRLHELLPAFLWCTVATAFGLLIATQSLAIIVVALAVTTFVLLAAITPLAPLAMLLTLAPLRTLIATEASFQLPLDIGQIVFAGMLAAWVAHSLAQRNTLPRIRWSPVYIPLLMFIVVGGLSAFSAFSLASWLNEWLKWVQMLILVAFVLSVAPQQRRWEWLLFTLAMSGLANALVGIYEFFGGSGADHLLIADFAAPRFRAFGTFGQPNPFGGFMGLLIPICAMAALGYMVRLWQSKHDARRLWQMAGLAFFYAITTVFLIAGIGVSWSRGAWLGFAASMGVVALTVPRRAWVGLTLIALLGLIFGALWFAGSLPASIVARINSATEEYFTISDVRGVDISPANYPVVERLAHWQAALNMARAHPWLGVGLGNYEVVYPIYRLINWKFPLGHAHNYYLNIFAETGIIGILVYGKVWIGILWLNWRARRHPDVFARLVTGGILGTWTYLFVHSIFDNLYVNNLFLHLGLILGLLAVLYNQARQYVNLRNL